MFKSEDYKEMILEIRNWYFNNKTNWNNLINKASELLYDEESFDPIIEPHFYSGYLLDPITKEYKDFKYIFITMNPKKRKNFKYSQTIDQVKEEDFFKSQNETLTKFTDQSDIYNKCEDVIKNLEKIKKSEKLYSELNKTSVIIDWFPFFGSSFNLCKPSHELSISLLIPILRILQRKKTICFVINKQIVKTIKKITSIEIYDIKKGKSELLEKIKLDIIKLKNVELFQIKDSILIVVPLLAKRTKPDIRVYSDMKILLESVKKVLI